MPRSIIDTESSRPAYRRRVLLRWVLAILVVALAAAAAVHFWQASRPKMVNQAPVPHYRRSYAA